MAQENNKKKAIESAVTQIEKQFGKGSIMRLGGEYTIPDIAVIPTGSISLDFALGIGGVPRGRVVEIYGPESSGKTTLALQIVAEAQKTGGIAAFIDAEHAVDIGYAQQLGVKTDELLISQPDTGEQALEIIANENPDLVLLDIMMPVLDGFIVCERIRKFSTVPIIVVTVKGEEQDRVRGLDMGADGLQRWHQFAKSGFTRMPGGDIDLLLSRLLEVHPA